jgi:hypothetical protein
MPRTKPYAVSYDLVSRQFATETIHARVTIIGSQEDYPRLRPEFTIGDGDGMGLIGAAKLAVTDRKLSDDQRYVSFRLLTTDDMTGADLRALMDAGRLVLRVVLHREVGSSPADAAQWQAASLSGVPSLPMSLSPVTNTIGVPLRFDVTDKQLIAWKMIPTVRQKKLVEHYYVRNPDLMTKAGSNIAAAVGLEAAMDRHGGQCGEFASWGRAWSRDFVSGLYGDKAALTEILIQRNVLMNHAATLLVKPDGSRYVIDYWRGFVKNIYQSTDDTQLCAVYEEREWLDAWIKELYSSMEAPNPLISQGDELEALRKLVAEKGEAEGLAEFQRQFKRLAPTIMHYRERLAAERQPGR